jgi:Spy/CpxP family protein refolding chaperone
MRSRSLALALSLGLAAVAVGCGGTAASEQASSASSATKGFDRATTGAADAPSRAPVAQNAHGPVKLLGEALGDVPMTPSQRAEIEQLATEAEARHAAARGARRDLTLAVAAQVEAGSIDRELLRPKIDALASAMAASQPSDRAAIERLHAILGPDQRTAFIDALEARLHERMGDMDGAGGPAHNGKLAHWAQELNLSDGQREQLKAALEQHFRAAREQGASRGQAGAHPWMEAKRRGAKLLDAFKQDRFVLDEVMPRQNPGEQAARSSEFFLGMAEAALPILTPEQRKAAAEKLRTRAEKAVAPGTL